MKEQITKCYELGRALHKLYDGELLNEEELNLIEITSNDECMTAFHL